MNRIAIPLVALLTAGLTFAAAAEEDGDKRLQSEYQETATVRERLLSSTTASVTVLDRERIEELNVDSVADLLRLMAGAGLTGSGSRGGFATAQVRGGDPNFAIVLIDGVPLNDTTDGFGGAVNLNTLSTHHIERVELVRGPVSTYYGSAGLAGVIHVITKRGGQGPRSGVSVGAGDGSRVRGSAFHAGGDDDRSHFVGIGWEEEERRVALESFRQLTVQANTTLATGAASTLRLNGRWAGHEIADYPDGSGGPLSGSGELRDSEGDELTLGADWSFGVKSDQRLYATLYRHELERVSPAIAPVVPPSSESTRFTQGRLGWNVSLSPTQHQDLTIGGELVTEQGRNDSVLLLPPVAGGPIDGSYDESRTTGAFIADWRAERGRLIWEIGLRADRPEDSDLELSPRLGLAAGFADGRRRLRMSVGRAFKLPSFYALASPAALGGNPELRAETSVGADLGLEQTGVLGRLHVSGTVFAMRYRDLIDFDFQSFSLVNRDVVSSYGTELDLRWSSGRRWTLHANLLWQHVESRATSETLRRRPRVTGGGQLAWRVSDKLSWRVDLQAVSDQQDQQIPAPTRDHVAGYAVLGSTLAYRPSSRWALRLRLDNIMDKTYETLIGYPGAGRAALISLAFRSP